MLVVAVPAAVSEVAVPVAVPMLAVPVVAAPMAMPVACGGAMAMPVAEPVLWRCLWRCLWWRCPWLCCGGGCGDALVAAPVVSRKRSPPLALVVEALTLSYTIARSRDRAPRGAQSLGLGPSLFMCGVNFS